MLDDAGGTYTVEVTPNPGQTFQMKGIGYGHPTWGHGSYHGDAVSHERQDYTPGDLPWQDPQNLHIQAVSKAVLTLPDGQVYEGIGSFEQLFIGPHAPSGFKDIFDPA